MIDDATRWAVYGPMSQQSVMLRVGECVLSESSTNLWTHTNCSTLSLHYKQLAAAWGEETQTTKELCVCVCACCDSDTLNGWKKSTFYVEQNAHNCGFLQPWHSTKVTNRLVWMVCTLSCTNCMYLGWYKLHILWVVLIVCNLYCDQHVQDGAVVV